MPTYYFNLRNTDAILDVEGTDLPDDEAACRHAVAVARELLDRNRGALGQHWSAYTMSVVDSRGAEVTSFAMTDFAGGSSDR